MLAGRMDIGLQGDGVSDHSHMLNGSRSFYLYRHLDTRTQSIDDRHQAINSESPQISIADTGKVCRRYPGAGLSLPHGKMLAIERLDNLGGHELGSDG